MILQSNSSGIDRLLASIRKAQTELPRITQEGAQRAGDTLKQQLSSAAPRGKSSGGPPPAGDAHGPLAGSFNAKAEQASSGATLELTTSQPLKLKYVTKGRGVVLPVNKRALFWPGLTHPVRRAGPSRPNDFVTPVLNRANDVVKAEMQKAIQEIRAILEG